MARREQVRLITDLEVQIQELDRQLAEGTLTAPYDGIVTLQHVSTGAVVSAGMPIVRLVQQDAFDVWVGMPAEIVDDLSADQEVMVHANGEHQAARLHAKLPELDETTRTRTVILRPIPEYSTGVVPGEIVQVQLRWSDSVAGFWLPISSLNRPDEGPWSIYVVEGRPGSQVVARRNIEVVHQQNGQVFARGNLVDGELVIADGTHRIVPRQQVISRNVASDHSSAAGIEPTS
jgi:RND family efflux transporter MFP subunit